MTVSVCVGSSCHLKGSYQVISLLREAIEKHGLQDKVEVAASFCLGHCTDGVCMKVDEEVVTGVRADNFDEIFEEHILKGL